jgi:hypothetical protein
VAEGNKKHNARALLLKTLKAEELVTGHQLKLRIPL